MNISNRDIMNCLPLLASVLGAKYGVEIRIGGKEAKTDGKVIYLPSLPSDLDAEMLDRARGYLDHEAAHIRHTDFNVMLAANMDKTTKWLFNAIEDWRVENRLAEVFPGCRHNFQRLIRKFLAGKESEGAVAGKPALSILNYVLLTLRSWDVPELKYDLQNLRREVEACAPGLPNALDRILNQIHAHCPDTQDAIVHANELADCIREWLSTQNDTQSGDNCNADPEVSKTEGNPGKPQQEGNNQSDMQTDADVSAAGKTGEKQHESGGNDFEGTSGKVSNAESDLEPKNGEGHAAQAGNGVEPTKSNPVTQADDLFSDECDLPRSFGELLGECLEAGKAENEKQGVIVGVIGQKEVGPLCADEKQAAMQSCNAMRHRLSGLLQAQAMRRVFSGRHGRLHTGNLYKLATGNPKIFRRAIEQCTLSTAVHILLDCSGSMVGSSMPLAREASYAVAKTLYGIAGVNPAITAFPADYEDNSVYPVLRHGQRLTENFMLRPAGDTPLGPAIWWAMNEILKLKEDRKIILIITDGVPNSPEAAQCAIERCRKLGIEVYGIGILLPFMENMLTVAHSRVIYRLSELAPAMFEILQNALLKRGKV